MLCVWVFGVWVRGGERRSRLGDVKYDLQNVTLLLQL